MLRLSEAAARLGVAPSTLRAFTDRGLIECHEMPNGERRFQPEAVEAFRLEGANPKPQRNSGVSPAEPRPAHRPKWADTPPWERPALEAEAAIRIEKARLEIARLADEERERVDQARRERFAAIAAQAEADRKQFEAERQERAERLSASFKPVADAVRAALEQRDLNEAKAAKESRRRLAKLIQLPEDRELEEMEAGYQRRKALSNLADVVRKFRR